MKKTLHASPTVAAFALAAALLGATTHVAARDNPVDAVSNPDKLDYRDVEARRPDFKEPFLRDGIVSRPERFREIKPGINQAQVLAVLGQALRQQPGALGTEWDYQFKFQMPRSANYLVCQYKVVFDGSQTVRSAVWRRRQCLDLVSH
ncbi:outer membrane protein assembly factor BamE (lipoprotein component of BamABCDE complex) [Variovorax boronicumulans]|uniref:outer membrane protein assembly factor BamE domain-containing protein n=1 Tax=Variovorax TaxID=34072 RepID=UPI002784DE79|nr:outer membrane protein assembly factor BamE [Variovorax boronicumulans]MDQ0073391.1 outer membrane protein assembly factor BamE (lipoprotein component of BamABCDE complex) [Variovorax boronicumulans]